MKRLFQICLSSAVLTGVAFGGEPAPTDSEADALRRELQEVKRVLGELQERIQLIEERLSADKLPPKPVYRWQVEQPFLWDSRQQLDLDMGMRRLLEQRRGLPGLDKGREPPPLSTAPLRSR